MLLHPLPECEGQFDALVGPSPACLVSPSDPADEKRVPMATSLFLILRPVPFHITRKPLKQVGILRGAFLPIPKCIGHFLNWPENRIKHRVDYAVRVRCLKTFARYSSSRRVQSFSNMNGYGLPLQSVLLSCS